MESFRFCLDLLKPSLGIDIYSVWDNLASEFTMRSRPVLTFGMLALSDFSFKLLRSLALLADYPVPCQQYVRERPLW